MALPRAGTPARGRELGARGQRTVRKLLDATAAALATRRFHALRVDDVVATAKTSHGTFYLYFANKEEALRALLAEVADDMAELAEELVDLSEDSLRAWLTDFGRLYRRHAPVIRAWVDAEIETHDFSRLGAEVLGRFAATLSERIAAAGAAVADPARAAIVVVAMIERCNYYATVGQIRATDEQLAAALAGAIHRSLFGT